MKLVVEVETRHFYMRSPMMRFTVSNLADGKEHTWEQVFSEIDEIHSLWDHVWERANKLLKQAVEESGKGMQR